MRAGVRSCIGESEAADVGGQDGVVRIRDLVLLAGRREHDGQAGPGPDGLQRHPLRVCHRCILLLMQPVADQLSWSGFCIASQALAEYLIAAYCSSCNPWHNSFPCERSASQFRPSLLTSSPHTAPHSTCGTAPFPVRVHRSPGLSVWPQNIQCR